MILHVKGGWWRDGLSVGCLCRTLPLSGPVWTGRLVIITEIIDVRQDGQTMYKVVDNDGNSTVLPYYSLEIIVDPNE